MDLRQAEDTRQSGVITESRTSKYSAWHGNRSFGQKWSGWLRPPRLQQRPDARVAGHDGVLGPLVDFAEVRPLVGHRQPGQGGAGASRCPRDGGRRPWSRTCWGTGSSSRWACNQASTGGPPCWCTAHRSPGPPQISICEAGGSPRRMGWAISSRGQQRLTRLWGRAPTPGAVEPPGPPAPGPHGVSICRAVPRPRAATTTPAGTAGVFRPAAAG